MGLLIKSLNLVLAFFNLIFYLLHFLEDLILLTLQLIDLSMDISALNSISSVQLLFQLINLIKDFFGIIEEIVLGVFLNELLLLIFKLFNLSINIHLLLIER